MPSQVREKQILYIVQTKRVYQEFWFTNKTFTSRLKAKNYYEHLVNDEKTTDIRKRLLVATVEQEFPEVSEPEEF